MRLRTLGRLVRAEATRELTSARLWALVGLVVGYGSLVIGAERDAVALGAGVLPSANLSVGVGLQVLWLLAFAAPLAIGGTLAGDRASGYVKLQLARGSTRGVVLAAHALALLAVAVVAVVVGSLAITCAALLTTALVAHPEIGSALPFAPALLERSFGAWLVLVCGINALATWAVLTLSLLACTLMRHPLVAQVTPPLVLLALGLSMTGHGAYPLNPFERLTFLQVHGASWNGPTSMLAYWSLVGVGLSLSALVCFRHTEGS